jgi:PhnB protein
MHLEPHLSFNGQCEVAFKFYEKCLGGRISLLLTYGDSPLAGQTPAHRHNQILHGVLSLGEQRITGSDAPPDQYQKPQGFSLTLNLDDVARAERIFAELAEKGTVEMPLQETFWALRFGVLVDQFGMPWEINCGKGEPQVS